MSPTARLLVLALALAAGGCASRAGGSRPGTYPVAGGGAGIVSQARTYTGTAYRAGGASPGGFDCSGFVQFLYGQAGVALPRTVESQFRVGRELRPRDITAGDLVFFRTDGHRVSHVGIATGDGGFIHAPNARSQVRVDQLEADYWSDRYAGARRIADR
jgi:cell wall-associated NlpC family hydrolase